MSRHVKHSQPALFTVPFLLALSICGTANAKIDGYTGDCGLCHMGNAENTTTFTMSPDPFEPGDLVRLTVNVTAPGMSSAGFFVNNNGIGELSAVDDSVSIRSNGTQATHTGPKGGGSVTFEMDWQAPPEPRAVNFTVFGLATNGNNADSGDTAMKQVVTRLFGCEGQTFYRDFDADGYGSETFATAVDCVPPAGFAALNGDCNEDKADINPGMEEACNSIDDNCDLRVDEFATPVCGVGLCMRYASSCGDTAPCIPGEPVPETCNGLDDNCDGMADDGDACTGDLVCHQAACKTIDEALAIDPNFIPYMGSQEPVSPPPMTGPGTAGAAGAPPITVEMPLQPTPQAGGSPGAIPMTAAPTLGQEPTSEAGCQVGLGARSSMAALSSVFAALALLFSRRRPRPAALR